VSIKAIFVIDNIGEESNGQVRASCKGKVLTGDGTGASFSQDFNFDPTAPSVHTQIAEAVKTYLQNSLSVSFGAGDVVAMLPNLL
jgi:hypothetical protein